MINNSKHQIISSNIAPNPIEVKFWLDTNSNILKTYKDGKWEAMTGGGSSSSSNESDVLDVTELLALDADDGTPVQVSEKFYNDVSKAIGKCKYAKVELKNDTTYLFYTGFLLWNITKTGNQNVTYFEIILYPVIDHNAQFTTIKCMYSADVKNKITIMSMS